MSTRDDIDEPGPASIVRRPLLTAAIDGGKRVDRVEIRHITLSAHQKTGLHLHPCPTLGHIVSGSILFEVEGQAARVLQPGDAFYEPANVRIVHFDNATEQPATFVAYYLLGPDQHELITMLPAEA